MTPLREVVGVESVRDQLSTLVSMVVGGLITGLIFDLYRLIRGVVRPRRLLTDIGDLLFWLVVASIIFIILVSDNWGQVRIYVFLGWAIGFLLYRAALSHAVISVVLAVAELCSKVMNGLSRFQTRFRRTVARPLYRARYRLASRWKRRHRSPSGQLKSSATARKRSRVRSPFRISYWLMNIRRAFNRNRMKR